MKRLLREPLLHFALLAAAIFAGYSMLGPAGPTRATESIVVSAGKIEQMSAIFARTWQRPPSPGELKGLIDDYVKEEIYVREALALGLDVNDTVIRRRLRQKMEFITSADVDALEPSDNDLQRYLDAHSEDFAELPQFSFQQVFVNPDNHSGKEEAVAGALQARLRADPETDPGQLGDGSLLPYDLPLMSLSGIKNGFSPDFAAAVAKAEPGIWTGPVTSAYGLHLFRVTARTPGRLPPLSEIRDAVLREWSNAQRQEMEASRIAELANRYRISIETVPIADPAQ